jgi:hypothetical protein
MARSPSVASPSAATAPAGSAVRRAWFALCGLGSIATLLGHLHGLASMRTLAIAVLAPSLFAMGALVADARRRGDRELLLIARAGFVGGLWGTLGYDWCRVPVHLLGQNPFVPIRAYGMWILGAPHSTALSDLVGLLYHFSNGLTFGWIYAAVALRRHWIWAVVWALALESLAVVTAFGEIFAIRYAPAALVIAYAAHVFYGAPLGWACRRLAARPAASAGGVALAALTALFAGWFLSAWQPVRDAPALVANEIVATPRALYPGWNDVAVGTRLALANRTADTVTFRYRHSSAAHGAGRAVTLAPGARDSIPIDRPGVYQVLAPGRPWRSVFVAARDGLHYRERSSP